MHIPPSIRSSVNFFAIIATSRIFFDTRLRCFPRSLVVSARKRFWSVDKCGRWQPALIFTFIASPPKQLEEFCRNLAYEFLSMVGCIRPENDFGLSNKNWFTFLLLYRVKNLFEQFYLLLKYSNGDTRELIYLILFVYYKYCLFKTSVYCLL